MPSLSELQTLLDIRPWFDVLIRSLRGDPNWADEAFSDIAYGIITRKVKCGHLDRDGQRRFLRKVFINWMMGKFRNRSRQARTLSLDVLEFLEPVLEEVAGLSEDWLKALEECLKPLPPGRVRELLDRFGLGRTVRQLKEDGDPRRADTIYKSHDALKRKLRECVELRIEKLHRS